MPFLLRRLSEAWEFLPLHGVIWVEIMQILHISRERAHLHTGGLHQVFKDNLGQFPEVKNSF